MKHGYWYLTAIILVVVAVAAAGCTSGNTASAGGQSSSGNAGSSAGSLASTGSPAPVSPSPAVGSIMSSTTVFSKNYNWLEYKTTSNYNGNQMTLTTRTEKSSGSYQGEPAVHLKMTTTNPTGQVTVTDLYYDQKNVLGGTMTTTVNGQTVTTDYPLSALQNNQRQGDYNTEYTLTFAGIEPVSVPSGTYPAAGKYTTTRNEAQITFWSAPAIPVPVKYVYTTAQGTSTAELIGWG
jgi:hypothetical protein